MENNRKYFAFISYKREDEKWAKWLQHKLEHYKLPSNLNGRTDLPKEIRPIFRDQSELAGGVLADEINKALSNSKYLIVICSPRAAQSVWVGKEVQTFIDLGRTDKIIPFIIGGMAHAQNPEEECFPLALLNLPPDQELLGINIDEMGRDAAAVKVVAQMFGLKFDALWQRYERELKKKRRFIVIGIVAFALVVLGVAGGIWRQNWKLLENQSRFVAEKVQTIAENDSYLSRLLALEVLPKDLKCPNRPYTPEAEVALRKSLLTENAVFRGPLDDVYTVSFNPDGTKIVSASADGTLSLWDMNTGKEKILYGDTIPIICAEFNHKGNRIIFVSYDDVIRIWDVNSLEEILVVDSGCIGVRSVEFSQNDEYFLVASDESKIQIRESENGCLVRTVVTERMFNNSSFSPDGNRIVYVAPFDDDVYVYDIDTEKKMILKGHKSGCVSASFSPDGKYIVSTSIDSTVRLWDAASGNEISVLVGHASTVNYASFSSDGKYIVSASDDRSIRIWETRTGKEVRCLLGHNDQVKKAVFSPNGKIIASASLDNTVRIWDWKKENKDQLFDAEVEYVRFASFLTLEGSSPVLAVGVHTVSELDSNSGEILGSGQDTSVYIVSAALSSDKKKLAISYYNEVILVIDVFSGEVIREIDAYEYHYMDDMFLGLKHSISFSFDGNQLLFAPNKNTASIWDLRTGDRSYYFVKDTMERINYAVFCPNEDYILLSESEGLVEIVDVKTGESMEVGIHGDDVNTAVFSHDGSMIVSASKDQTVKIIDVNSEEISHTFIGHNSNVNIAVFSPDDKYVVSGAVDGMLIVWDVELGLEIKRFKGHAGRILTIDFSQDQKQILTTSYDGTVRIWDFPPLQDLIDQTRERFKDRPLTPEERHQYYLE